MLSKAAYYMQDHIRRNYALISEIATPTVIMARGRQPFPQGLHAIAKIFTGRLPAHVYAHRYFMERQSDPSQPSPQLHITEESQGILKVMGGMRYMRDNSSKLDSTVVLMTDYSVTVKGRMLCIHEEDLKARQRSMGPLGSASTVGTRDGEEMEKDVESVVGSSSCAVDGNLCRRTSSPPLPPGTLARSGSRGSRGRGGGLGKGIGVGSGGFQGMMQSSHGSDLGGAATGPPVFPSPDDEEEMDAFGGAGEAAAASLRSTPQGTGSMVDRRRSYHFFHVALYPRSAPASLQEGKYSSSSSPAKKASEDDSHTKKIGGEEEEWSFHPVFQEKEGGYTVLYNPVEVSDKTFADLLHKLHAEERVVGTIVLPTKHAWRHVQLWADAFPDATILSSGPVPVEEANDSVPVYHGGLSSSTSSSSSSSFSPLSSASDEKEKASVGECHTGTSTTPPSLRTEAIARPVRGGCQEMGGGVMGLSFPEVEDAEGHGATGLSSPPLPDPSAAASPPHHFPRIESATVSFTSSLGHRSDENALVDSILRYPGEMYLKPFVGLRREDARRVILLRSPEDVCSASSTNVQESSAERETHAVRTSPTTLPFPAVYVSDDEIHLTPSLQLHYIRGDPNAEEFVLYDAQSQTLACTELFHGEYSDFDPVNSWMARVWFKFMKRGNHKRVDLVPRDKWLGIRDGNKDQKKGPVASVSLVRQSIDRLTRKLPIQLLVYAHGTPPLADNPARMLRRQWGMPE